MMRIIFGLIKLLVIYPLILIGLVGVIFYFVLGLVTNPSNDRDWSPDQAVLPYAEIDNNLVSVHNVRNFTYASTTSYIPNYYDKTYDVDKIVRVWYVVEPFSGLAGSAHTFLSFEFENNEFVSISVEIRKEMGETFSAWKGLLNQYEIMYVIADERDVIKLRSNFRKDRVFVYPIRATKEKAAALFLDMIRRTNELKENPEFYNTITNNCTITIARHVNEISPKRLPFFSLKFILPAESDNLAFDLGLIDTDLTFEQARQKFLINSRALEFADSMDFSAKIRGLDETVELP